MVRPDHWYMESPAYSILIPLPMVFVPPPLLPMIYRTTYSWYFEPPTHGTSNPLSMMYRTPYSWHIEPPTYGISNPLPMDYRTLAHLLIRNEGVQNTLGFNLPYRGFNIPCMKIDPGVNIPWGSKYHMTLGLNP